MENNIYIFKKHNPYKLNSYNKTMSFQKNVVLSILSLVLIVSLASVVIAGGYYERPCGEVDICDWDLESRDYYDFGLPLGSPNIPYCADQGINLHYNTFWEVGSDEFPSLATAICEFEGSQLEEAMLYVSINNDIVSCTLNGDAVFGSESHEGCAPEDPRDGYSQDIYNSVIEGENTLVCELKD